MHDCGRDREPARPHRDRVHLRRRVIGAILGGVAGLAELVVGLQLSAQAVIADATLLVLVATSLGAGVILARRARRVDATGPGIVTRIGSAILNGALLLLAAGSSLLTLRLEDSGASSRPALVVVGIAGTVLDVVLLLVVMPALPHGSRRMPRFGLLGGALGSLVVTAIGAGLAAGIGAIAIVVVIAAVGLAQCAMVARIRLADVPPPGDREWDLRAPYTWLMLVAGSIGVGWLWSTMYVFFSLQRVLGARVSVPHELIGGWLTALGLVLGVVLLLPLVRRHTWIVVVATALLGVACIALWLAVEAGETAITVVLVVLINACAFGPFVAFVHLTRRLPETPLGTWIDRSFGGIVVMLVCLVVVIADGTPEPWVLALFGAVTLVLLPCIWFVLPRVAETDARRSSLIAAPFVALARDRRVRWAVAVQFLSATSIGMYDPLLKLEAEALLGTNLATTVSAFSALAFPLGAFLATIYGIASKNHGRLLQTACQFTALGLGLALLFGLWSSGAWMWVGITAVIVARVALETGTTIVTLNSWRVEPELGATTTGEAVMGGLQVGKALGYFTGSAIGMQLWSLVGWWLAVGLALALALLSVGLTSRRARACLSM